MGLIKQLSNISTQKKDGVIDRVVERASVKIARKGLPKFLEKMGKQLKLIFTSCGWEKGIMDVFW